MQKSSFLFLLLITAIALLGAYHATFKIPASTAMVRFTALSGFMLICVSLSIGPLSLIWPKTFAQVIEPRRAIGIAAFVFAAIHSLLHLGIVMGWNPDYLLVPPMILTAIPATLLLFVLAITSSDYAIKKLGAGAWKNIQRLNYFIFVMVLAHFINKANGLPLPGPGQGLNVAEILLLALGIATALLQISGFLIRRSRAAMSGARAKEART